MKTATA